MVYLWSSLNGSKTMADLNLLWIGFTLVTLNLMTLIFLGNAIVIVCVFQYKRLQTSANYIVVSLAATDILLALCLPFPLFENWAGPDSYVGLLFNHVQATASGASILTVSIIAYDRYSAVSNPLSYKTEMTKRKTFSFIGFAWCFSVIVSWMPLLVGWFNGFSFNTPFSSQGFLHSTYTLQLITMFVPSCCALFFCYANVYCIARHHSLAIEALEMSLKSNRRTCRNTKYSRTISSIIGTFLSLWLPFQIGVFLTNIVNINITYTVWKMLHYLAFFNSVLNPWVYALKTSDFQSAFKQLCGCAFKSRKIETFINKKAKIVSVPNHRQEYVAVLPVYQTDLRHSYQTKELLLTYQERKFSSRSIGTWSPAKLAKQVTHTSHLQIKNKRLIYPQNPPIHTKSFIL